MADTRKKKIMVRTTDKKTGKKGKIKATSIRDAVLKTPTNTSIHRTKGGQKIGEAATAKKNKKAGTTQKKKAPAKKAGTSPKKLTAQQKTGKAVARRIRAQVKSGGGGMGGGGAAKLQRTPSQRLKRIVY